MKRFKHITIGIIIGILIFGSVVYAATSIYSSNVTYDNSNSGLISTNVQGAIDELYIKSQSLRGIATSINYQYSKETKSTVTTAGGEVITQVASQGLMQDSFGNIRYYGADPNNYITFNGEEAGWRIIGVFDVEDANGNTEKRIKLIRATSIGDYAYDDNSNDWTTATLNTYLNSDYYTNLAIDSKNMIGQAKYYLGGNSSILGLYADDYYNFERGTTVYSGYQTEWTGYVGIMYPSDYAYATDLSVCSKDGYYYDIDTNCKGEDWLLDASNTTWTIAPDSANSSYAFDVFSAGGISNYINSVSNEYGVRPVVYLDADVSIIEGSGEKNNPYVLANKSVTYSASSYVTNLYEETKSKTVTTAGDEKIIQASEVNLMEDSFGNVRYYGANPNNYVTFNGEEAGWRIIGVFKTEDENGNVEKRVKLIRATSIGSYAYDNKTSGVGSSTSNYGSSDWTDARLMMLLNPGYETASSLYAYEGSLYWNRKSGTCYSGENSGTTTCSFTSIGLTDEAKNMIGQAKYYLGESSITRGLYADDYYYFERGTTVYTGHQSEWIGYIGLMYPSDYAYATDLSVCTKDGYNYDSDVNCKGENWLFNNFVLWTLSPSLSVNDAAYIVTSNGAIGNNSCYAGYGILPVLYLNSNVSIVSGEGTSDNPYVLG